MRTTYALENRGICFLLLALWVLNTKLRSSVVVGDLSRALAVLILSRIIKSVVTGQAPVTLELRNTLGKNTKKPKVVHACITADAIHASTRNI